MSALVTFLDSLDIYALATMLISSGALFSSFRLAHLDIHLSKMLLLWIPVNISPEIRWKYGSSKIKEKTETRSSSSYEVYLSPRAKMKLGLKERSVMGFDRIGAVRSPVLLLSWESQVAYKMERS